MTEDKIASKRSLKSLRAFWRETPGVTLALIAKWLNMTDSTAWKAINAKKGAPRLTCDQVNMLREKIKEIGKVINDAR